MTSVLRLNAVAPVIGMRALGPCLSTFASNPNSRLHPTLHKMIISKIHHSTHDEA